MREEDAVREGTGLTSSAVADALTRTGLDCQTIEVTAFSDLSIVGPAVTVKLCREEAAPGQFSDFLDAVTEGVVVVVDNGGRRGHSVFGGLVCAESLRRGAVGAVVNGDVRDVEEARRLRFGLFALGRTPRSGRDVARLEATDVAIEVAGVSVRPGDTVVADGDGVVVVPSAHATEVLELARSIEASDAAILEMVSAGTPLSEARRARR